MAFDLVIRNATVIDGTRAPRFQADIAVSAGKIAEIGFFGGKAKKEIDATGKIAAPGFIDAHTHDDRLMLSSPDMAPKVSQGVTTVVAGNCGISLAPAPRGMSAPVLPPIDLLDDGGAWFRFPTFRSYVEELEAHPAATNCALLVGHTMLRAQVMDDVGRPANGNETGKMRAMTEEALAAGAIGVSTGLYYEPARAATTQEVIEVCRPLGARRGIYCTHMRDEGDRVVACDQPDGHGDTFQRERDRHRVLAAEVIGQPPEERAREPVGDPVERQRQRQQRKTEDHHVRQTEIRGERPHL